jgi:hypothetical protein
MSDVHEAVARARAAMAMALQHARTRLLAGTDLRQIQGAIDTAVRYMEDVEAYALLAAEGSVDAQEAITQRIAQLEDICDSLADQDG